MGLIDYSATGTTALKNWEIMTKAGDEKLEYDNSQSFWPFHAMFVTHIHNMDWMDVLTFTVGGTDLNLTDKYGQIERQTIEAARLDNEATLVATPDSAVALKKKLKCQAIYTYLFNCLDSKFKKYLTNNSTNHKHYGPSAWKIITEHCVKNDNQNIRRALCKTHTMNLADFDNDVDKLITAIEENNNVLSASGKIDSSVTANLFRILKAAPCEEFVTWVLNKQTTWDEGQAFDVENFMRNARIKYNSLVNDGLWKKVKTTEDLKKDSEIVALTATVKELKAFMANSKQNNNGNRNANSGWRNKPPADKEPTTITKNGKTYNWCIHHKFWTQTHTSDTCRKGNTGNENAEKNNINQQLTLKMAEHDFSIFDENEDTYGTSVNS